MTNTTVTKQASEIKVGDVIKNTFGDYKVTSVETDGLSVSIYMVDTSDGAQSHKVCDADVQIEVYELTEATPADPTDAPESVADDTSAGDVAQVSELNILSIIAEHPMLTMYTFAWLTDTNPANVDGIKAITAIINQLIEKKLVVKSSKNNMAMYDITDKGRVVLQTQSDVQITAQKTHTQGEIEALKANWFNDPCWDIEETEGFEAYHDELLAYRLETEATWKDAELDRQLERASLLKIDIHVLRVIETLEARIKELEVQISSHDRHLRSIAQA